VSCAACRCVGYLWVSVVTTCLLTLWLRCGLLTLWLRCSLLDESRRPHMPVPLPHSLISIHHLQWSCRLRPPFEFTSPRSPSLKSCTILMATRICSVNWRFTTLPSVINIPKCDHHIHTHIMGINPPLKASC